MIGSKRIRPDLTLTAQVAEKNRCTVRPAPEDVDSSSPVPSIALFREVDPLPESYAVEVRLVDE
jgi:hypothetical protein